MNPNFRPLVIAALWLAGIGALIAQTTSPPAYAAAPATYAQWVESVGYTTYIVTSGTAALTTPLGMTPRSLIYRNGLLQTPNVDWTPGPGTFTLLFATTGDQVTVVTFQ